MSSGRWPRRRVAVLLAVLPVVVVPACGREDEGTAETAVAAPSLPASPEELEPLVVEEVPSGLPRLPDAEIEPPAGAKRVEDVAGYADDPARERAVLRDYDYRHGWERFWGPGTGEGPLTGVFIDQFEDGEGAGAYAEDLARNDAAHYGGLLSEGDPDLPDGCRELQVAEPRRPELSGPAAFVWCTRGPFSVAVTAVAASLDGATDEVHAVVVAQLDRLPAG
ncbi:hypothetical protein [Candidatus Blastococcus massiliensis]|uniref:hypothetical protein n=1 Tax=Candidatus Blastococcus massiliensis TaxID=1470358 RepID=UPI0004B15E93|nr:hypothetical protein [Candidatus Blastococcus massiliensis]